ncbi:MAG: CHAP domain-containing protein [Proteobacteria bacterium]|jgi:hypothetical protein|nr:CHAP domain-containing protein [Pseudomonadota bacterium]
MTAEQFIKKYTGVKIDYDGIYGFQCVDVIKQYFVDVLNLPAYTNNAKDYWNNYPSSYLTRIPNTPSFIPIKGDIMVWGTGVGTYGHIAIVVEANVNTFISLDQNWSPSNGTTGCKLITHNYSSVLGVLRPIRDVNFDQEAFNREQARIAEESRVKAELAKKIADDAQKAEAKRIADEQKRLAEEQAKLDAELLEKKKKELEQKTDIDLITEEMEKIEVKKITLLDYLKMIIKLIGDLWK